MWGKKINTILENDQRIRSHGRRKEEEAKKAIVEEEEEANKQITLWVRGRGRGAMRFEETGEAGDRRI